MLGKRDPEPFIPSSGLPAEQEPEQREGLETKLEESQTSQEQFAPSGRLMEETNLVSQNFNVNQYSNTTENLRKAVGVV